MKKLPLVTDILSYLNQELANSEQAARNAHLAATDDQSVAETQYDTLAIESAYLAEGQSRRIVEFKRAITAYEKLKLTFNQDLSILKSSLEITVTLGSLVQLHNDIEKQHWFFIGPAAAGYRTTIAEINFTVITPLSPVGKALLGKRIDDDIMVNIGNRILTDDIAYIY